jgi:poly(beta-D-mannuronate) lyase
MMRISSLFVLPFVLASMLVAPVGRVCAVQETLVTSISELQKAVAQAGPGDVIVLKDGAYTEACKLTGKGTKDNPIVVRSQTIGGADLKGGISVNGEYVTLLGFSFTGKGGVSFAGKGHRMSRCHMDNVQAQKWLTAGPDCRELEIDYCLFENKQVNRRKKTGSQVIQIWVQNMSENHHIHHNHFRNIPKGKGSNGFETMQLITRGNPFNPKGGDAGFVVEHNLFEQCDGESEIISVKSNGNQLRNNTFLNCQGSLVLRHGHRNVASGNIFIGCRGGIRVQGKDQWVVNNYLQDGAGAAIVLMDGTPNDLYVQVERATIAHNTVSDYTLGMSIGLNHSQHPVGTPPKDCVIVGNIFQYRGDNQNVAAIQLVKGDEPINWTWVDNIVYGNLGMPARDGIMEGDPKLTKAEAGVFIPTSATPVSRYVFKDSQALDVDLAGNARHGARTVGAIQFPIDKVPPAPLTEKQVGPDAFVENF